MSIHIELEGLDDVAADTFKAKSGKTDVSLTIASVAGKRRTFKLTGLASEITRVKVAQQKGNQTVSQKLAKDEQSGHKLLNRNSQDDDRQHETLGSHIASAKEGVEDDTAKSANSSTDITSLVSQMALSDLFKDLEEPFPGKDEAEVDCQKP